MKCLIHVYADWLATTPAIVGRLVAEPVRGSEYFSFEYSSEWLQRADSMALKP